MEALRTHLGTAEGKDWKSALDTARKEHLRVTKRRSNRRRPSEPQSTVSKRTSYKSTKSPPVRHIEDTWAVTDWQLGGEMEAGRLYNDVVGRPRINRFGYAQGPENSKERKQQLDNVWSLDFPELHDDGFPLKHWAKQG